MADDKNKNSFFSTKQSSRDSSSKDIASQVKAGIDMSVLSVLNSMSKDLNLIMRKVVQQGNGKPKDKPVIKGGVESKPQKSMSKDELKNIKKINKEKEKSQKKIEKQIEKSQNGNFMVKGLKGAMKEMTNAMKKAMEDVTFKNAMATMTDTSAKIISGSSMKVNKELRDLQIGMGLSSTQAMSLDSSMKKMGIAKEDLAYLTGGQRELLGSLTSTMEKAYESTDMDAIAEMGNSMFEMQVVLGVLKDVLILKLQEVLTVLKPVIDMIIVLLYQVIDSVIAIFDSPEVQAIIEMLGMVVGGLVEKLMPIIQTLLGVVVDTIMSLLTMLMPLVMELVPVVMLFVDVIIALLVPLMPIIAMAINLVMQLIQILVPIIIGLLPIVVMMLEMIGVLISMLLPMLMPALMLIGQVLEFLLPLIYIVVASVFNAIIMLYNFFVSEKKEKAYMDTSISLDTSTSFSMPPIDVAVDMPSYEDPVAKNYAGANNVDSISNDTTNINVDANFNSNINGEASEYAGAIQEANYSSASLLASIIEEGS